MLLTAVKNGVLGESVRVRAFDFMSMLTTAYAGGASWNPAKAQTLELDADGFAAPAWMAGYGTHSVPFVGQGDSKALLGALGPEAGLTFKAFLRAVVEGADGFIIE